MNTKLFDTDVVNTTYSTGCPMCGTTKYVVVRTKDAIDWEKGKHIQDAFPYLSANDREALITGYCGPCWDREFDDPSGIH